MELHRGRVDVDAQLCKGCLLCVRACPPGVLQPDGAINRRGYESVAYAGSGCTGCGICFYVCPEPGAIAVSVRETARVQ
jgi:2-oxoglutarate ferredoxin oxidoreductase subunit delta